MKKIIFTLLLLVFSVLAKAQNLIGYSARDVHKTLNEKGFIIGQGYTKDNIYYISGTDRESVRLYYFSSNNVCSMYAVSYLGYTYTQIVEVLKAAGYWQSEGNFYTTNYQATILYMSEYDCYFVVIIAR